MNCPAPQVPLSLYAAGFAVDDLTLYLDTHPEDARAMALYRHLIGEMKKENAAYRAAGGILFREDAAGGDEFLWFNGKAPWEV